MRLIDADELLTVTDIREDGSEVTYVLYDDIENAPTIERPRGEWLRMSNLSEQEDNRYKCSKCSNVVYYKNKIDLYTFNSWCNRCGSFNGRKIFVETDKAESEVE